jgi:hypothetical protein
MQVIYPGDRRLELDGGKNNKFARSLIENNESPDCLNVTFSEGAVETREGTNSLTVSGIGSYTVDGLFNREDNTQAETMIAWANGTAWTLEVNTFATISSAQSVYTAGQAVCATQYENHIFFGNGASTPYKYNGTDFTRHGSYPPAGASGTPTPSTAGVAGNLNGDYQWKVTYVNSNLVESDVGPAPATFTASSEQVTLTGMPLGAQSWGVASRKLYRTATSGTTFNLVATISDNTTTDYTDNVADADLGADAPTDQGVPPLYSICIYYRDRLFVNDPSNPNFIWYSELGNPYVFKATNFKKFGDNTTDIVRCFGIVQNSLVIFGDESFEFLYMPDTTPANWATVPGAKQYGCKSPRGIFNFEDKLMFPAIQNGKFVGFAALNSQGIDPDATYLTVLSAFSELQSNRIEPDMFQIQEAYLDNISSTVYKNKAYIGVTHGAGNTENNRVLEFDFSRSNIAKNQKYTWSPWTGLNSKDMVIKEGTLYYSDSSANLGHVYEMLDGTYNDNGVAIDSYFWTKEFDGGKKDTHFYKDLRRAYIFCELSGDWYMDFVVRTDSESTGGDTHAVHLLPGGSTWGTMTWGVDNWGGGLDEDEKQVYLGNGGRRFQFKFSNQNTINQKFKIHGFGFNYNRKGLR